LDTASRPKRHSKPADLSELAEGRARIAPRSCTFLDDHSGIVGDLVSLWRVPTEYLVLGPFSMRVALRKLREFQLDTSGVTAIEYGLIASGIGMAIVLVVISVGSALQVIFTDVQSGLTTSI
jgi:Flp pilus assembly pilin Flp